MLNMMNVDSNKRNENKFIVGNLKSFSHENSDEEKSFSYKKDIILPTLKIQNPLNFNISGDLLKSDEDNDSLLIRENQKPKM